LGRFDGVGELTFAFPPQGIPTHDLAGEEVAKNKRKNLTKEYEQQVKLHEEWKKWKAETATATAVNGN